MANPGKFKMDLTLPESPSQHLKNTDLEHVPHGRSMPCFELHVYISRVWDAKFSWPLKGSEEVFLSELQQIHYP